MNRTIPMGHFKKGTSLSYHSLPLRIAHNIAVVEFKLFEMGDVQQNYRQWQRSFAAVIEFNEYELKDNQTELNVSPVYFNQACLHSYDSNFNDAIQILSQLVGRIGDKPHDALIIVPELFQFQMLLFSLHLATKNAAAALAILDQLELKARNRNSENGLGIRDDKSRLFTLLYQSIQLLDVLHEPQQYIAPFQAPLDNLNVYIHLMNARKYRRDNLTSSLELEKARQCMGYSTMLAKTVQQCVFYNHLSILNFDLNCNTAATLYQDKSDSMKHDLKSKGYCVHWTQ
jgi:hypothetical protein